MTDAAHGEAAAPAGLRPGSLLPALVFAAAVGALGLAARDRAWAATFVTYVLAVLLEAVPFLIIGAVISGAVAIFLPADLLPRAVRRLGRADLPATMGLSFVLPVCECGVVAVARGLLRKGLPLRCTIVYLLVAPILNPVVLASTAVAFQFEPRFVIARLLGAVFVSVPVALFLGGLSPDDVFTASFRRTLAAGDGGPSAGPARDRRRKMGELCAHAAADLLEMIPYLVMGVALAAVMQTFVGSRLLGGLAGNRVGGAGAMMGTAFTLSLCSEADAFVARTFYGTFDFPAVIAFLVLGPMLDIKLLLMYRTVFSKRVIACLAASVTTGVVVYVILLCGVMP
jgi:uncharacterized membrane protein YraQ (UPF0718 family)